MLREEQESGDYQQDQKNDAHSRRQESASWFQLLVSVAMMRHAILSSDIDRIKNTDIITRFRNI
jgi:hypothetical protein